MAEHKYDGLLADYDDEKEVKKQPWYKERLRTKYLKLLKPGEKLDGINTKSWVLLRARMDDFRDGYPPDFDGVYFLPGSKGLLPNVFGKEKDSFAIRLKKNGYKNNKQRPFLTREQLEMDRQTPLIKMRQDHIHEVEYGLTQHPLALYPHLEEGMPPELFDELVDILDPAMNPDSATEDGYSDSETSDKSTEENEEKLIYGREQGTTDSLNSNDADTNSHEEEESPFDWMIEVVEIDELTGLKIKKKPTHPPPSQGQDEHIKQVTRKFCDWVSDLGGDSNNIEESTVMSLFASGYETKPALSVPIHVVELSYIPAELRETAGMPSQDLVNKSREGSAKMIRKGPKTETGDGYEPSWIKTKFGAWYLKPTTWRLMRADQQLEDPKEVMKREQSDSKKKSNQMDSELASIHGSRAFRSFLERKQRRMPEFMAKVALMQDIEDEEQRKEDEIKRATTAAGNSIATTKRSSMAGL